MDIKPDHLLIWFKYTAKICLYPFDIYMHIKGNKIHSNNSEVVHFASLAIDKPTFPTQANNAATSVLLLTYQSTREINMTRTCKNGDDTNLVLNNIHWNLTQREFNSTRKQNCPAQIDPDLSYQRIQVGNEP